MTTWIAALLASSLRAQRPEGGLPQAERQARQAVEESRRESRSRHQELERLRKDLRYVSEELDREVVGARKDLEGYSRGGLRRIKALRQAPEEQGGLHRKLGPALDRLEKIYSDLPRKDYARDYAKGLVKAVAHELRWAAEEDQARTASELLALLEAHLAVPDRAPGQEDAFEDLALFPVDLPLDQFKRLGPIRIFLVKHRLKRPKTHAAATWQAVVAGKHNVQVGVELAGTVVHGGNAVDFDYTFDFGDLHIELTPEWRLLHPDIPRPEAGQRVRVKGWTYYDVFHKAEEEYDPEDPSLGMSRATLWEVHPVQEIELLP